MERHVRARHAEPARELKPRPAGSGGPQTSTGDFRSTRADACPIERMGNTFSDAGMTPSLGHDIASLSGVIPGPRERERSRGKSLPPRRRGPGIEVRGRLLSLRLGTGAAASASTARQSVPPGSWIPACAGMTQVGWRVRVRRTRLRSGAHVLADCEVGPPHPVRLMTCSRLPIAWRGLRRALASHGEQPSPRRGEGEARAARTRPVRNAPGLAKLLKPRLGWARSAHP